MNENDGAISLFILSLKQSEFNGIKMNRKTYHELLPYLFIIAFYALVTLGGMISSHIFLDGFTYASIARNLSMGKGTFWDLYYTADFPHFISHPPFALWIESLIFRIFGDSIWVERYWGTFLGFCSLLLVLLIWIYLQKEESIRSGNTFEFSGSWWPVFILLTMPGFLWCISNNMIENTLVILVLLYSYVILRSFNENLLPLIVLSLFSGLILYLAVLTKGPPGLFPVILPVAALLFPNSFSRKRALIISFISIVSFLLIFYVVMIHLRKDGVLFWNEYFLLQLKPSIEGNLEVATDRLLLLKALIRQFISIGIILLITGTKKVSERKKYTRDSGSLLLVLGGGGSLPFLLFRKQMIWYLMPSLPFFALGIAVLFDSSGKQITKWFIRSLILRRVLQGISLYLIVLCLFVQIGYKGQLDMKVKIVVRDAIQTKIFHNKIDWSKSEYAWHNFNRDILKTGYNLEGALISIDTSLHDKWRMIAYFQRMYGASLVQNNHSFFFLTGSLEKSRAPNWRYKPVKGMNGFYKLYILK